MTKTEIKKVYIRLLRAKNNTGVPTLKDLAAEFNISPSAIKGRMERNGYSLTSIESEVFTTHPELFPANHIVGRRNSRSKDDLLKIFAEFRKTLGKPVTRNDIFNYAKNFTRAELEHHFGSVSRAEELARKKFPEYFNTMPISHIQANASKKTLESVLKTKKLFITTAVSDKPVDQDCYETVKKWCAMTGGKLVILPSSDPASIKSSVGEELLDSIFSKNNDFVLTETIAINSNLCLSDIRIQAKQIDPTTGLDRLAQKYGSTIVASPKQRWRPVCVDDVFKPKMIMSTGAITSPFYESKFTVAQRTGKIAEMDHVMGGIIVDIDSDLCFPRRVTFKEDGSFIDMGLLYTKEGATSVHTLLAKPGDWHAGETDEGAKKAFKEACNFFKPDYVTADDIFNGKSISPFLKRRKLSQALIANKEVDLKTELRMMCEEINFLKSLANKKLIVIKSNHDEWLYDYIDEGRYLQDPKNVEIGARLTAAVLGGYDPIQFAYEELFDNGPQEDIVFLRKDQGFILDGVEVGRHGHRGSRGNRNPGLQELRNAYFVGIFGHAHESEIINNCIRVGCMQILNPDYTQGHPGNWTHSFAVEYEGGDTQLFFIFDGKWRVK